MSLAQQRMQDLEKKVQRLSLIVEEILCELKVSVYDSQKMDGSPAVRFKSWDDE